jgi:hypothetical protein
LASTARYKRSRSDGSRDSAPTIAIHLSRWPNAPPSVTVPISVQTTPDGSLRADQV